MPTTAFEYSGNIFGPSQLEKFNESIGRDFYSSETEVDRKADDIYINNSRAFAGYIPISMHRSRQVATLTRRSWKQVRNSASDVYLIWLTVRGSVTITQGGHTAVVKPGGLALSSSNEPLCIGTAPDDQHEHLSFQILAPAHVVHRALPEPKRLCGVAFPTTQGGASVACDLFLSLYEQAEFMDRSSAEGLAMSAMEAIFKAIHQTGMEQSRSLGVKEAKLQRLLDYLELHYCDSELSTEKVAKACNISMRYLHYLLKSKGKRFYDYLWQSRLECAYRQLTDPSLSRRTIAEIAYSAGFKSSAHFSRAFRNHFQCSPKEVRLSAAAEEGSAPSAQIAAPATMVLS